MWGKRTSVAGKPDPRGGGVTRSLASGTGSHYFAAGERTPAQERGGAKMLWASQSWTVQEVFFVEPRAAKSRNSRATAGGACAAPRRATAPPPPPPPRAATRMSAGTGRNGRGRAPDASRTIEFEETDASRTRPQPFLPVGPQRGSGGACPLPDARCCGIQPMIRFRCPGISKVSMELMYCGDFARIPGSYIPHNPPGGDRSGGAPCVLARPAPLLKRLRTLPDFLVWFGLVWCEARGLKRWRPTKTI
eukprot:gene14296-biopygen18625